MTTATPEQPTVSIVIPAWNKWEYTRRCLASLREHTGDVDHEIILVDNGSTDETPAELARTPGIRVHRNESNLGFARASNQGAALAHGRYLLFLNNDTEATRGWLPPMVALLDGDRSIGMVGAKLLYPDGTIQHAGVAVAYASPLPINPFHLDYRQPAGKSTRQLDLPVVTAACMLVRPEIFRAAGGFDETYVNGYEDVDLCFKVREAGHRIVYTPTSVLIHHESVSDGRFLQTLQNEDLLERRWMGRFTAFDHDRRKGPRPPAPAADRPSVSVVVPVKDALRTLAPCLEDLALNLGPSDRLLVSDAGSRDCTLQFVRLFAAEHPGMVEILEGAADLPAAARAGLERAAGALAMVIQPELRMRSGFADEIVGALGRLGASTVVCIPLPKGGLCVAGAPGLLRDLIRDAPHALLEQDAGELEAAVKRHGHARLMIAKPNVDQGTAAQQAPAPASSPAPAPPAAALPSPRATAPDASRPAVSIVIPVFNKVAYTRNCLTALAANTPGDLFEVIIVDNGSTDETPQLLRSLEGDVRVITNPANAGFVSACNQGASAARGEHLLFLNNDTAPQKGWLEALLSLLSSDARIGAAGSRLVYPDGRLQEAGGLVFSDGSGWNFGRGDPEPFKPAYNAAAEVDYCSGAALIVRRALFEQLGGFDSRYAPAYYEDTDLCFGLRSIGYQVRYCPESVVVHFEGVTAGTSTGAGFKQYQVVNREKFKAKWGEALAQQDAPPSVTGSPPLTADRVARGLRGGARPGPARAPRVEPIGDRTRVLVVDPCLPLHDQSSGGLRLYRLVRLFREAGCDVTFIARNAQGQERYRRDLEALGVTTYATDPEKMAECGVAVTAPRVDLGRILSERHFDLAWFSFYYIAEQYLPEVRRLSPRTALAVDTVDIHFVRELRQAQLAGDAAAAEKALATRQRELRIYGMADLVVTVTEADGQALREAGLSFLMGVVPNIHPRVGSTRPFHKRRGLVFVGGFKHPPNVDAAIWFCREIFPVVQARHPGTRLALVGAEPPPEVLALGSRTVTVTGWVPDTVPLLDAARVSIAPLRAGAGMKGKVGEALARGLPVVATRVAAEGMALEHETNVLLADTPEAFAGEISRLLVDQNLWSRLAAAGRHHVEERFSPEIVRARVGEILAWARARSRDAFRPRVTAVPVGPSTDSEAATRKADPLERDNVG